MSNNTNIIEKRSKYGAITSLIGIGANLALSIAKLIIGVFTSSVALMADAVNNFSDAGSSIISLISFKLSEKPADREHPFGHARIEYIASMIVSFLILHVGFDTLSSAIETIFKGDDSKQPNFTAVSFIILGVSVFVKLCLALFYRRVGKKIDSAVITATSLDSFFDSVSTLAVLISTIVIKYTNFAIIDSIIGTLLSVMIIITGIKLLNETKNSILGEAPVNEIKQSIKKIVGNYSEVIGTHDLLVHNYGPNRFVASFHAEVDGNQDIYLLHDVIDNLERRISDELNIFCTIHLDPITLNNEATNRAKDEIKSIIQKIDEKIYFHDFRMVVGKTHTNLIFDLEVPYENKSSDDQIKDMVERNVKEMHEDYYCVITVDRY